MMTISVDLDDALWISDDACRVKPLLQGKGTRPLIVAGVALVVGLLAVIWLDWQATRHELLALLRDQAASLQQTVMAAARSNRQAGEQVGEQLAARLLDNARLLAELDRRGALDEPFLSELVRRHSLFRVSLYAPDGSVQLGSSTAGRQQRGRGGPGRLVQELIGDGKQEATTDVHQSRWGEPRVAAGVRRSNGGAIVLNVDATAAEVLERQVSLDALLGDIVASAPELSYIVFEQGPIRIAHGDVPPGKLGPDPQASSGEREREVDGRPILELDGPIAFGAVATGRLSLGMRLDGVRAAERRMLLQMGLSLGVSLALTTVGVGALWLRRRYGVLSQQHADAEAALRRRDRLAAMGELASGVAHEVRNPLNAIAMSVKRLRREFRSGTITTDERAELDELLDVLDGQTRRIDATVQQFLTYARPRPPAPRSVNVDQFLAHVGEASRALAGSRGVTLEVASTEIGLATLDPEQIGQALDNLLRNALQATSEGGVVALAAHREGAVVVIELTDTGIGIFPEDLPRIFDLYFTTKSDGTGVGLAVTHQVITAHGGTIDVASHPGEGTRFTIRIPAASEGGDR